MVKKQPTSITLCNYSWLHKCVSKRDNIRDGGVSMHLFERIMKFKRRSDIENIEPELEHI